MSPFLTVFVSLLLLTIAGFIISKLIPLEAFGTQGGALVQLATSHVPTEEDVYQWQQEKKRIRHDLVDLTGGW